MAMGRYLDLARSLAEPKIGQLTIKHVGTGWAVMRQQSPVFETNEEAWRWMRAWTFGRLNAAADRKYPGGGD